MSEPKSSPKPEIIFLKSNRVVLRPVLREDIPLLIKWINDPGVRMYLGRNLPVMEADEQEWFDTLHKRKATDLVFTIIADGTPIGVMGLHRIDLINGTATTGALIGEKEYWGKGYGTEAKMLLLSYAFHWLGLYKIRSTVIAYNGRSRRYSEKCGYREDGGPGKEEFFRFGRRWDEICLAVFRKDWEPLWQKFAQEHDLTAPDGT